MEDRSTLPHPNPRKRLRSDDRTSPFKYAHTTAPPPPAHASPPPTDHRIRHDPRSSDPMMPSTAPADQTAPILQPLHPPIPNFTAISQGVPRSNPIPNQSNDIPPGMSYNIALPLPNPGRAHRFCQACDHINHVRRKLCENCGAPKPSALRNAIGVRPVTDPDLSNRQPQPYDTYSDPLRARVPNPPHQLPYRQPPPPDQRSSNPIIHQAHSLAMRCPGDDIPLLGNTSRPPQIQPAYHNLAADPANSHRLRLAPALLSEPLINFGALPPQDHTRAPNPIVLNSAVHQRQPYGMVDFSQKMFDHSAVDRADHLTLPSMNGAGAAAQHHHPSALHAQPLGRSQPLDPVAHPGFTFNRPHDQSALPEDMIPVHRSTVLGELETTSRPVVPRYHHQTMQTIQGVQSVQGMPLVRPREYSDPLDAQTSPTFSYTQGEVFGQQQQTAVPVSANTTQQPTSFRVVTADERREDANKDRKFESTSVDGDGGTKGIGRYLDSQADGFRADEQAQGEGRNEQQTAEEVNRPDDGRFAIENILMQHKNNVASGGG